ncbi:MAG: YtxH domain-containing protein [Calditrichia bacterium]|nr:YtxH domain-containing protein [Calditrichota bacterium]MCB0270721.1 YtxH domain-containing protein [Calditrichota bacterium]MCB0287337.1 YtxH domain-containing protein [Calditrichota bacterium]MCB9068649.1 YtxH domain-containing protein [Calditrichia bacterium]
MSDSRALEFIKGLLIGGAVGAVAALLYAPKSGRETREELGGRMDDVYAKAREEYEASLERARRSYDSTISRIKDLENTAKAKAEEMEEVVGDVIDQGKDRVENSRGRLKDALDAARNAFREDKEQSTDSDDEKS